MADTGNTTIQVSNLDQTFQALKNKDFSKVKQLNTNRTPDYKKIPNQNFAPTTSVSGAFNGGMNKFASASGGGGMIYGQPQFFSPVHTPINWQIPSRRLEIYQWLHLPHTQVIMEDYTYNDIENTPFNCDNVIEDSLTNGFIFETSDYPKIMNSEGVFNHPPRISMRDCYNKRCFSFEAIGNYRSLRVSEEHQLFVLDGELHRKNKKTLGNKKYRAKKGIISNGVEKVKIQNKLIKKIQAQEIKRSDYLLTPVPQVGNITLNKNLAWLIGFCVADGIISNDNNGYSVRFTGCKDEKSLDYCKKILEDNFDSTISSKQHGDGKGWRVCISTKKAHNFFRTYIVNKGIEKKFTKAIFELDKETRLNILAGYLDGDGSFSKREKQLVANCYSKDLMDQIYWLLVSCKINCSIGKYSLCKNHYPTSSDCYYKILIPNSKTLSISGYMNSGKVPSDFVPKKERELKFFYIEDGITYLAQPIDKIEEFLYTGKGYDIEMTNERHALVASGYVCSNCRFFYSNEPKIAASIDFYSNFPMNGFENECKDREVKKHFDKLVKRIDLSKWLRLISHEVHLLGDCFPFLEISCEHCGGSGKYGDEICEHEGGTVRRVVILNPDYVEVYTSSINPDTVIALRPDEEIINMIQKKTPGYDKLAPEVRALFSSGKPVRLDNRNVSHLKYGESGYERYGTGMVRRLFPILSYKTKLMVAQWIVAERLIIPIKIVKVGSDERPAGPADIAAVQEQLAQTANDPNLTIVTHHAFDMDWIGSCYDDQTEVLTENGWKKYNDVSKNKDEKIATYNLNKDCIEYQIPEEYHEYSFDGEMCSFNDSINIDVSVTPNHNMLISKDNNTWEKVEAKDVNGNVYFKNIDQINDTSISNFYIKDNNIFKTKYNGKVWCFTVSNGFFVTRRNGKISIHGNSGKVLTLSNEFELINQEILDGMMINNALLNGEGPNFCLSACSRILCDTGLKYKDELDIEKDLIATFNKETGALEYQKAIRKYEYNHDSINGDSKPLKHFLTNRIDMLVTDNHRMLYAPRQISGRKEGYGEWSVVEAADVKNRGRFRACVDKWVGTEEPKNEYFGIEANDFLKIVGWYVSEGWKIVSKKSKKILNIGIAQCPIANSETYLKIKTVLEKYNICHVHSSRKDAFYISNTMNKDLVSYLGENCGEKANTKRVPKELKNLPSEYLKSILEGLVDGDGSERPATKKKPTDKKYYSYTTVSTQLRDDVIEILFKLGYSPRFSIIKFDSPNLQTQYTISWSDTENGKFPVLDSRKWNGPNNPQTQNQVISDEDYIGKVWCVEVPNHFIITERNGLFGIHGNSNAAVGIEAMIERLQTFRREIADWVEQKIYLPEAKRQGFIDPNADSEDEEYIYPKLKFNSMHLRDQQQFRTFALQLYEKGLLSAQTILETFDYDPDQEIERKRYDAIQMAALGQGMGAGGGGGGGMPGGDMGGGFGGMGGGGGGMPPMPGGDAGGGMGGMGGGDAGGAPISAPPAGAPQMATTKNSITTVSENNMANPSNYGGRVLKQKTRAKLDSEKQKIYDKKQVQNPNQSGMMGMRDSKGRIVFTKCERQLLDQLQNYAKNGLIRYPIIPQFEVKFGSITYPIDFAFPHLKIGLEADGEAFHSSPKQITHDKERDMKLSQVGWTILRFKDEEIEKQPERVMSTIVKTIMQKESSLEAQKDLIK